MKVESQYSIFSKLMKEILISASIVDFEALKPRIAVRAFIIKDNPRKILVQHLELKDIFTIPGGGQEDGETLEETVIREVKEETGYECEIVRLLMVIKEYREEHDFSQVNYCYIVKAMNKGSSSLTDKELSLKIRCDWMDVDEYKHILESKVVDDIQMSYVRKRDIAMINEYLSSFEQI